MWPDKPQEYVRLEEDQLGKHYGLFWDQTLVSIVSCFEEGGVAQFRKFATLTNQQGTGYGSQLLKYLLEELRRNGIGKVWCNARKYKLEFYRRFGLEPTERTFRKGGIDYVIMEKIW